MISKIQVVLDRPRTLVISRCALERMKEACGVDLLRGDKMRTHYQRCCFVWSMINDADLRPDDLAAHLTPEKFLEITEAIEIAKAKMRRSTERPLMKRITGISQIWFSRS